MKIKNYYIRTLALAIGITLISCNKKLDITPRESIDAIGAIQTAADVDNVVIGAYSVMGGGALYGTNLLMVPEIFASHSPETEQYASWRGTFTGFQQIARKTLNRDNGEAARIWTAAYQAINTANLVLDALPVVTDADQKKQFEGEALFIRGIMHFELVRLFALPWGATAANDHLGVVIKLKAAKVEAEAAERLPRGTVAQVYTQVITDLIAASQKLPEDNGTRADRFAALAFLAKVYLQKADYVKARDAADEIISSGLYEMNPSLITVFDNKNTSEAIFEVQQNEQNNAGTSNDGMATFFASLPGVGRGDVRVSTNFLGTYDSADYRLQKWYYEGTGSRPGNMYTSKWKSFSQNLPVARIAEIYLIRAEANLRLGTVVGDTPQNDLAQVRNPARVRLPIIVNPTLSDVLFERSRELAFEGFKIHEIKRLKGSFSNYTWSDNILVLPIPHAEVEATEGVLVQNAGY